MKNLYLDCFSGISGNMMIGALLDAGVPEEHLKTQLQKLNLPDEYNLIIKKTNKNGINCIYFNVTLGRIHTHHRTLNDIEKIIKEAALDESVQSIALNIFKNLAAAEAKVHGKNITDVHFHEVGAIDAIIDIVGTAVCLDYLKIRDIFVSNLHTGKGFIECAHGTMPVPAPATAQLLQGFTFASGNIEKELITPTGAAIVKTLAKQISGATDFSYDKIAYGAGTWELSQPNVLRAYLKNNNDDTAHRELLLLLEANIDDMSPQVYSYATEKLFTIGALDVWTTSIMMKKGRPSQMLSVLIQKHDYDAACSIIFRETTTLGIRAKEVSRISLERKTKLIPTSYGDIHCKFAYKEGHVCNISAEYDDCYKLAAEKGIPLRVIQQAAVLAAYKLHKNK